MNIHAKTTENEENKMMRVGFYEECRNPYEPFNYHLLSINFQEYSSTYTFEYLHYIFYSFAHISFRQAISNTK